MVKISAGILLYRRTGKSLEVFLVHPGGPYWKHKDTGAWSIPKGEADGESDYLAVARREFFEETSFRIEDCSRGEFIPLQPVKQKNGKTVYAFAAEGNLDAAQIRSETCFIEWPPRSGKQVEIEEVDRGEWFALDEARVKMNAGQVGLLDQLEEKLG